MWDPNGSEVGQVGPTCPDESHLGPMWASCQGTDNTAPLTFIQYYDSLSGGVIMSYYLGCPLLPILHQLYWIERENRLHV